MSGPIQANRQGGWLRVAADLLLDALYPPHCVLCGTSLRHGRSLCDGCGDGLPRLEEPFCQICGEVFPGKIDRGFVCPNCSELSFAFEFARPALRRDTATLELIHRLKYGRELHLARELGRLAGHAFVDPRLAPAVAGGWPLVPVPLHRRRMQFRHFNQAGEIARVLGGEVGLPVVHGLRRVRRTDTQTRLSRKQRLDNLRGAFEVTRDCRRWIEAKPAGALLIDDVLTTGSTVHECARTLRRAGFNRVWVVTVMRS